MIKPLMIIPRSPPPSGLNLSRNSSQDSQCDACGARVAVLINGGRAMKSLVMKRSIVIVGHKTSVSLEDAFWRGLKEIAVERDITLSELVTSIDSGRPNG